MDKVQFYLCDKKKDCNKSLSCILGQCMYTTDPNHCANKGIKEPEIDIREWLGSFNTESATECFNAVQELKKRLEDTKND